MNKTFETYCPACDKPVKADIIYDAETLEVKGEPIEYNAAFLRCPDCGLPIGDSRIESENLKTAYKLYCQQHDLMTPEEVKALRNQYGLSVREFSRFLGLGEQTAARFEAGSIPSKTSNDLLRLATTQSGAAQLLERNRGNLHGSSIVKIEQFIAPDGYSAARFFINPQWIKKATETAPSSTNGYRSLNMERVAALATILANKCTNLYKTKLQKAFFFVDNLNYERTSRSLTGMIYAHAPRGPIMDGMDEVMMSLKQTGYIDVIEDDYGEILIAASDTPDCFNDKELSLIYEVVEFVNSFSTVSAISEYSHGLDAWKSTENGIVIEYGANFGQVEKAIDNKLQVT